MKRTLATLVLGILLGAIGIEAVRAAPAPTQAPITVQSVSSADWVSHCIFKDPATGLPTGANWLLAYYDANGNEVQGIRRLFTVNSSCTTITRDIGGTQTPPAALCTSLNSEVTQTNNFVSSCVSTTSKCNPN